ncbi:hypothetical protein H2248_004291 [Termitomyces sp. 'cryptogamus']|nr:hypothetical protein H2248_004291 [Termitomyces sp. 'cryptogamus']
MTEIVSPAWVVVVGHYLRGPRANNRVPYYIVTIRVGVYSPLINCKVVRSRTRKPVKYYLIDFDLSKEYPPGGPSRLEEPPWGGDKTVPEHLIPDAPPCDPFPVDVYCLGNCIRENFLDGDEFHKGRKGFEFMRELVDDMTNPDPLKRPQMSQAASRLNSIIDGLSDWQLRSPIVEVGQRTKVTTFVKHWTKQLVRKARGIPAIPKV